MWLAILLTVGWLIGSHRLRSELPQLRQEYWKVVLHDAPHKVVIDPKVAIDEPIPHGDDPPPGNLRICVADAGGNAGCRVTDEFQMTQRRVAMEITGDKPVLLKTGSVREHFLRKDDRVVQEKTAMSVEGRQT